MGCKTGIVTDIQHYSVHDGPGIRTIVFLKGCPMRCKWCSNPETQEIYPELGYNVKSCILCKTCVSVCPEKCIIATDESIMVDREKCIRCFKCQQVCSTGALRRFGYTKTTEEVMDEVKKDMVFYEYSGGGLTLSGGECLVQHDFVLDLLKSAKKSGINTAIETTGYAEENILLMVAEYPDHILYDLKHIYPQRHKDMTGVSNELILSNLQQLVDKGFKPVIRIPVVPGFNDDENTIDGFIEIMSKLGLKTVHLLPLHHLGKNKYQQLDKDYFFKELITPDKKDMEKIKNSFLENGINASIGG
jgi:pyruvate formate lyase activating enzyme